MSKHTIDSFLPATVDILTKYSLGRSIYDMLLPESVAQACPEFSIDLTVLDSDWTIRQPALLLTAIAGMGIGFRGFLRFSPPFAKFYQGLPVWVWGYAFLTFGLMNLSAAFLHCLYPSFAHSASETYTTMYPYTWAMDTYMTGVSASLLSLASWNSTQRGKNSMAYTSILAMLVPCLGLACWAWFLLDPAPRYLTRTLPLEQWYVLPILAAAPPVVHWLFIEQNPSASQKPNVTTASLEALAGQLIFVAGVLSVALGVVLDRWLCETYKNSFGDALTTSTCLFFGCDLAFWGIELCLLQQISSLKTTKHHGD